MRVDLHIHTTASDGCWTPRRVIEESLKIGLEVLAITDHDSVASLPDTWQLAQAHGLRFVPGVEISCTLQGELYHILGLGIDHTEPSLNKLLDSNWALMEQKDDDSIRSLIARGHSLDIQEYHNYRYDLTRGGWKALNYLIDKNICTGPSDFFSKLFAREPVPFPNFPHPEEVLKVIKKAGGTAILAHPGGNMGGDLNKQNLQIEKTLALFLELGLEGLECYHPSHSQEATKICLEWCKSNKRLISGGSDCHGEFIPSRRLGQPVLTVAQLQLGNLLA